MVTGPASGVLVSYPKGVVPVTDARGAVVGYDAPSVGFVEPSVVESPSFNVNDYVAKHALRQTHVRLMHAPARACPTPNRTTMVRCEERIA
jgi:hypothetical protein